MKSIIAPDHLQLDSSTKNKQLHVRGVYVQKKYFQQQRIANYSWPSVHINYEMRKGGINILQSICFVAILIALCRLMVAHFQDVHYTFDGLDEEARILRDIRQYYPKASELAFATNMPDEESSQAAYYYTQFLWCPDILSGQIKDHDTILLYHSFASRDSLPSGLKAADTLFRESGAGYELLLLSKTSKD